MEADDSHRQLVTIGDPSGTTYREFLSAPQILVPSPRVNIVADTAYNSSGKLQELGTSDRPFVSRAPNDLKPLLENLPAFSRVELGPGIYEVTPTLAGGIDLRKDILIQGAGMESSEIKAPAGSGVAGLTSRLISAAAHGAGDHDVAIEIEDLKINCNFANSGIAVNSAINAYRSGCTRAVLRNVHVVGCGEFQKPSESFHVWALCNADDHINEAFFEGVIYDEEYRDVRIAGLGATALHIGSQAQRNGVVNGHIRDCVIRRNTRGVCIGTSVTDRLIIEKNRVFGVDATAAGANPGNFYESVGILHDSGTARNVTVRDNYVSATGLSPHMVVASAGGSFDWLIKDNIFDRLTRSRQLNANLRLGLGNQVVMGNQIIGNGPVGAAPAGIPCQFTTFLSPTMDVALIDNLSTKAALATIAPTARPQLKIERGNNFIDDGSTIL